MTDERGFNMEMKMEATTAEETAAASGEVEHVEELPRVEDKAMGEEQAWAEQWGDETASVVYTDPGTGVSSWASQETVALSADNGAVEAEQPMEGGEENDEEVSSAEGLPPGSWVVQYDPSAKQGYYYNTLTEEARWDAPDGFVEGAPPDEKMAGAVKIQSVFRSKKARDHVKTMAEGGEVESTTIAAEPGETPPVEATSRPQSASSASGEMLMSSRVWKQHYDPRSQQYYYHNVETGESTWEKPTGEGELFTDSDPQGDSVVKIQCAFRKRAASKSVETKKIVVRDLISSEVIAQKLKDLMNAVDEIQAELEARKQTLSATTAHKHAHLEESVASWIVSVAYIRDRVLDHHHHARLVQQMESTGADKLATAQQFHDALAATRSECLALLKSVLVTDSSFLEVDVLRVNEAFERYAHYKQDGLFSISESKIRNIIRVDELQTALATAESSLRKAMGMTDFNAGATTTMAKIYGEWRSDVQEAVDNVSQLAKVMGHKRDLLALYQHSVTESKEIKDMQREDELSWACERAARKLEAARLAHLRFLEKCRQSWLKGLNRRQEDNQAIEAVTQAREIKRQSEKARIEQMAAADQERRKRVKLSIWEAVREGHSIDVIRAMVYAEMQKSRQNGFDFVIRTARSDRGESLVQIACWGGHTELVEYFLNEGADLHAVDNVYNRFTLLHDASRRGHAQIIRLLVDRGLQQDSVDGSGDTPIHWAVRKNHYDAVHTLLGAYMHRHDPDHNECALRAVRTKNHRGRTPIQLTKSECTRRLLQAFDEGRIRIPQFNARLGGGGGGGGGSPHHNHGRRKSEQVGGSISRASSSRSLTGGDTKGNQHGSLLKAATETAHHHGQSQSHSHGHGHDEDEFGAITVLTAR